MNGQTESEKTLGEAGKLIDGSFLDVVRSTDGGITGVTERIKVRKIPVRHMADLGRAWGKEPKEVAVYADRNDEWVAQLTDESFERVIEEGRRINFTYFEKWAKRQMQTLKVMGQSDAMDKIFSDAVAEARR